MNAGKLIVVLAYALLGWGLCAATRSLGLAVLPPADALLISAIAAPLVFIFLSRSYFRKFAYTTPLLTACLFAAVFMLADFFVVARSIYHSYEMFGSLLGTWLLYVLSFTATHLTGLITSIMPRRRVPVR